MAEDIFGFGEEETQRIADAVRLVESQFLFEHDKRARQPIINSPLTHIVRVTSTTPLSGRYPAKWQLRDESAQTWSDQGDVWAIGANDETLIVRRYLARVVGLTADGVMVFATFCCAEDTVTVDCCHCPIKKRLYAVFQTDSTTDCFIIFNCLEVPIDWSEANQRWEGNALSGDSSTTVYVRLTCVSGCLVAEVSCDGSTFVSMGTPLFGSVCSPTNVMYEAFFDGTQCCADSVEKIRLQVSECGVPWCGCVVAA